MRFLGVGETCDLGALYLRLQEEGHDVVVSISDDDAHGTLRGLIKQTHDWKDELAWVKAAPDLGIVLFESVSVGVGQLQDDLRAKGFNVIGGSAYGDRLENDRAYAQQVFAELGFPKGHVWEFGDPADAVRHIERHPHRYVLKFSGADHDAHQTYVGAFADGADVRAIIDAKRQQGLDTPVVLMQHIDGVEMGVGAYFNGDRFLEPACLDWEHKHFFAGDLGELTGEMGTVVTFDRSAKFFGATLGRMEERLRRNGYVGYINLNTIVNEDGIWPLEFTCRFGYPGFAVLSPLHDSWSALLASMIKRNRTHHDTAAGFSVGVVLTTPPFPYSRRQLREPAGLPVIITADTTARRDLHYGEVGCDDAGHLVTTGRYGWTMVATGVADTISLAKARAYTQARAVVTPNLRYRLDIGDKLIATDFAQVERLGLLDTI